MRPDAPWRTRENSFAWRESGLTLKVITRFGTLLLLDPLPHLFNLQAARKLPGVVPLVPFDFPLERLLLPLEGRKNGASPVLGRLLVFVSVDGVGPAQHPPCIDLALLVVAEPHELARRDVLDLRHPLRGLDLLAAVFGRDQFPGADEFSLRLRLLGGRPPGRDAEQTDQGRQDHHQLLSHGSLRFEWPSPTRSCGSTPSP